jgi:hypothetical protein
MIQKSSSLKIGLGNGAKSALGAHGTELTSPKNINPGKAAVKITVNLLHLLMKQPLALEQNHLHHLLT